MWLSVRGCARWSGAARGLRCRRHAAVSVSKRRAPRGRGRVPKSTPRSARKLLRCSTINNRKKKKKILEDHYVYDSIVLRRRQRIEIGNERAGCGARVRAANFSGDESYRCGTSESRHCRDELSPRKLIVVVNWTSPSLREYTLNNENPNTAETRINRVDGASTVSAAKIQSSRKSV